jgi:hypothetical protein
MPNTPPNIHTLFTQQKEQAMWDYISWQRDMPLGVDFIRKNAEVLNWEGISKNPKLPWSIELIDEFAQRWEWKLLSENLANSTDSKLFEQLLEKYGHLLSWNQICSGTALTPSLAQKHDKYIDWNWLSGNPSFAWNIEFLERYKSQIDWLIFSDLFCCKVNLWDRISVLDFMSAFRDYINWNFLSNSDFISIIPEMLEEFEDKWDWNSISYHPNICWTEELVARFGHNITSFFDFSLKTTHVWSCLGEQEFKKFVRANPDFGESVSR